MRWQFLIFGMLVAALPVTAQPALTTPAPEPVPADTTPAPPQPEVKVLVAEVQVVQSKAKTPLNAELESQIYKVIKTRPGQTTTRSQLQEDINAVFATGYFSDVKANPQDTPLGVRVTFDVVPNPALTTVVPTTKLKILPQEQIDKIFAEQKGKTLNYGKLQQGVKDVEEWYASQGYVLAKVTDVQSTPDGQVNLSITEGEIEEIRVKGNTRTRDYVITRELTTKPGDIFNRDRIQFELQRVFALNLFKDVSLELNPGKDDKKVIVALKIEEKNTGSLGAGGGVSSIGGLFGTLSYQEQNLGGNGQKAGLDLQVGTQQTQFNINFTDPWLNSDPYHTSLNTSIYARNTFSYIFDQNIGLPNGAGLPRENRLGTSLTFARPLADGWRGTLGSRLERVQLRDYLGSSYVVDQLGNPLTASGTDTDNIFALESSVSRDTRDSLTTTTRGSFLRYGLDQTVPVLSGAFYTRLRADYSTFTPAPGLLPIGDGQQILAFNTSLGTILGLFPPYEAFTLGGNNSVRGFFEGTLGTGRSFMTNTAEIRTPLFDPISGVLFLDYGTDLGSAASVLGSPAIVRGKPGSGLGYGFGFRLQSPLGPLRIDLGLNTVTSGSQVHFGLGEKF